jgi:hypothetical protein
MDFQDVRKLGIGEGLLERAGLRGWRAFAYAEWR